MRFKIKMKYFINLIYKLKLKKNLFKFFQYNKSFNKINICIRI